MKAKGLILKVVNETEKGTYEIKDFKPYMVYESFIGCIHATTEVLRPTGIKDIKKEMVYENYIIEVEELIGDKRKYNCVVYYNDSNARFEATEIRTDIKYVHDMSVLNYLCRIRILGNIYQNKDLLIGLL